MPMPPRPSMVLRKRVPVIVPLHEVANSAAVPPSASNPNDQTPSTLPPIPVLPAASTAHPATLSSQRSSQFSRHLPARKNKRLRPSLTPHTQSQQQSQHPHPQDSLPLPPVSIHNNPVDRAAPNQHHQPSHPQHPQALPPTLRQNPSCLPSNSALASIPPTAFAAPNMSGPPTVNSCSQPPDQLADATRNSDPSSSVVPRPPSAASLPPKPPIAKRTSAKLKKPRKARMSKTLEEMANTRRRPTLAKEAKGARSPAISHAIESNLSNIPTQSMPVNNPASVNTPMHTSFPSGSIPSSSRLAQAPASVSHAKHPSIFSALHLPGDGAPGSTKASSASKIISPAKGTTSMKVSALSNSFIHSAELSESPLASNTANLPVEATAPYDKPIAPVRAASAKFGTTTRPLAPTRAATILKAEASMKLSPNGKSPTITPTTTPRGRNASAPFGIDEIMPDKIRGAREEPRSEEPYLKAKVAMKERAVSNEAHTATVATNVSAGRTRRSASLSKAPIFAANTRSSPTAHATVPGAAAIAAASVRSTTSSAKVERGQLPAPVNSTASRSQSIVSARASSQANGPSSRRSRDDGPIKKSPAAQSIPVSTGRASKANSQPHSTSSKAQSSSEASKALLRTSSGADSVSRSEPSSSKKKRRIDDELSPNGLALPAPEDLSSNGLMKIALIAKQKDVLWTKIKGHPYWPTQVVKLDEMLQQDPRFQQALRFQRKGEASCVMYFGTCEVAYVNRSKACIAWADGISKGLHGTRKSRIGFRQALIEVKTFCSRTPRFPRGWWCEPPVLSLAADLTEYVQSEKSLAALRPVFTSAETELIYWAKIRGFPQWPIQILPRNMAAENYPELKLGENGGDVNFVPCMFYGTAEVAMVLERNLTPFGAGVFRGYLGDSDRHDFSVAIGEVWGYLQEPRVWPGGYLSGKTWWNFEEVTNPNGGGDGDSGSVRVPQIPQYEQIKKSVWMDGVDQFPKPKASDVACCGCKPQGRECRCVDASCLNFASHFLCDASCLTGSFCKNINFHKRGGPDMTPFFTADQRGWGLKVDEPLKRGSFVIEYIGEIINRDLLEKRLKTIENDKNNEYYMMDLENDLLVDAKFKGNLSRFINSSCEPNCETQKWTDPSTGQTHVGIFAIRDIAVGTELTYNYCFLDFGLSGKSRKRSFSCQCGTSSCCMLTPIEQKLMKKLVGQRLEVRWDDGWYPGVVELYSLKKKRFRVQYDDGDCEDLVLGLPTEKDDDVAFRLVQDKRSDDKSDSRDSKNSKTKKG